MQKETNFFSAKCSDKLIDANKVLLRSLLDVFLPTLTSIVMKPVGLSSGPKQGVKLETRKMAMWRKSLGRSRYRT